MPPPPLFAHTIVSSAPARRAASRPPMSCRSASSPVSRKVGPPVPIAAPSADDAVPSIPFAPRFDRKRSRFAARRHERLHVADRHRGGDPDRRVVGRRLDGRHPGARLEVVGRGGQRPRHEVVGAAPLAEPFLVRLRDCAIAAHSGPGAACTIVSAVGSARATSRAGRPRAVPSPRATRAAASTWACRRSAARAPAGAPPPTRRCAAARRSARSRASGRAGPQRRPDSGSASTGQPVAAASAATGSAGVPAPHTIAPRFVPDIRAAIGAASGGSDAGVYTWTHGPPSGRPSQSEGSSSSRTGASGSRSGKLRCTTPGRPPRAVCQARQPSARWWMAESRPADGCPPPRTTWRTSRTASPGRSPGRRRCRAARAAGRR